MTPPPATDGLAEALAQIHNALHADDIDRAHELVHQALEAGEVDVEPNRHLSDTDAAAFANAFLDLCQTHGVQAAFVLSEPAGRLLSGGDAAVNAMLDEAVRALMSKRVEERPEPPGPPPTPNRQQRRGAKR